MKYLSRDNLGHIKFFGTYVESALRQTASAWVYTSFNMQGGKPVLRPNEFVNGDRKMIYSGHPRDSQSILIPNIAERFEKRGPTIPLLDSALSRPFNLPAAAMLNVYQPVADTENPLSFNIKGRDCVSCHTGQSARTLTKHGAEILPNNLLLEALEREDYPKGVQRFSMPGVTLKRIPYLFAEHYFGVRFPPLQERDQIRKIMGIFPGEHDDITKSDPIWRVDYVQRRLCYFNFIPMISQRSINDSGLTASLINSRVDFESFDLNSPPDPELKLREYFKVYTTDRKDYRKDLSWLWQSFYECLEPIIIKEFHSGGSLIPTVGFLEQLGDGNLDSQRFTGASERNTCDLAKMNLNSVQTSFMFTGKDLKSRKR
jgi:hypothetical protein